MRSALRTFCEQPILPEVLSFCKSMVVIPIGTKGGLTRSTGIWCTGMVEIANPRPIDAVTTTVTGSEDKGITMTVIGVVEKGITTNVTGGMATRGITTKARRPGGVSPNTLKAIGGAGVQGV